MTSHAAGLGELAQLSADLTALVLEVIKTEK
jgi:hypothetical protein